MTSVPAASGGPEMPRHALVGEAATMPTRGALAALESTLTKPSARAVVIHSRLRRARGKRCEAPVCSGLASDLDPLGRAAPSLGTSGRIRSVMSLPNTSGVAVPDLCQRQDGSHAAGASRGEAEARRGLRVASQSSLARTTPATIISDNASTPRRCSPTQPGEADPIPAAPILQPDPWPGLCAGRECQCSGVLG